MKTSTKMLGLGLGLALAVAMPAAAAELKMMTGPQGGSWIPLGGQLKDLWEKAVPGLVVQQAPGAGIELVGWVGRDVLSDLYRRARALVFPPRWQEPFGIVGLEALSFGVPVVAWESGGVGEWHPGPGLVRWGDLPALAGALREAVSRRISLPPRFEREEAMGRLLLLYGRIAFS